MKQRSVICNEEDMGGRARVTIILGLRFELTSIIQTILGSLGSGTTARFTGE